MMEMVRGLTALSKRKKRGDENGGDEDGGVSGALVPRTERDEGEGSSEGGGFYKSRDLRRFFPAVVSFFFFFFCLGETTGLFGLGWVSLARFFVSDIFHHFVAFFHIYCHFFRSLQNEIQSNKNLKIIIITSIK